ncbi:RNA polymerase factor sigma-54 [Neobacillus sp. PS3-40]|uniref:RNA polymerase factor sigma-54 n=1 Tax=Neobacillus sp. PS3-40 TaxID=3070679 RepID=UPI0027DEDC20|nr:RNA polymerase factor sigma-54 [Neobacillus sp. PS3-40]WML45986.1 RNA polymerase factor sigma-54 [Neobacillus sp. PS3-40]
MNLKVGLWQQQTLRLAMTQELTQAIALLQYSAQELTAFLENKALENPLLIIKSRSNRTHRNVKSDQTNWIEQIADKSFSLEELLLSQINFKKYSLTQLTIIKEIIRNLDESGYFREDIQGIAEKCNVPFELVQEGLSIIQTLEPAGIGARSLQECLHLQLQWQDPKNELAQTIISKFFTPFAERKWKIISKELQVSMKEIQEVFDRVKLLNPKPCAEYSIVSTSYIIPDAIIEATSEGLQVRLCDDLIPRIGLNEKYYKKFGASNDKQVNQFLNEKYQDFQWIMKSIEQRKDTLAKVISEIIKKQPEFFHKGPKFLRPLTMKEISQELEVHESTISRAVREKFVQTPHGVFSLKSFFSSMIQTVSEESTSSSQVKTAILALLKKEDKLNPYSDQELVVRLKNDDGIVVSRRTIAKYRDQLGIPSSSKRRRFE